MAMCKQQEKLIKATFVIDILIFCSARIIGLFYGKIGASGIVNGIILYYYLFKGKHWARICFEIFSCLGIILAVTSVIGNILMPWASSAPLFGYANIICGITYIFTAILGRKILTIQ